MNRWMPLSFGSFLLAALIVACSTNVPPAAVAWNDRASVLGPPTTVAPRADGSEGYLRVETDTDVRVNGSLSYDNVRRPFDLYGSDGTLLRADIDNRGGRNGEDPVSLALPPGRYVVASVYGTTYRKLQVEVRPGATTEVPASVLRESAPVFAR
jgi:hypothetical protein